MTANELHTLVVSNILYNLTDSLNQDYIEIAKAKGKKKDVYFINRSKALVNLILANSNYQRVFKDYFKYTTDATNEQYVKAIKALSDRISTLVNLSESQAFLVNNCIDGIQKGIIPLYLPANTIELQKIAQEVGIDIVPLKKILTAVSSHGYKFEE